MTGDLPATLDMAQNNNKWEEISGYETMGTLGTVLQVGPK